LYTLIVIRNVILAGNYAGILVLILNLSNVPSSIGPFVIEDITDEIRAARSGEQTTYEFSFEGTSMTPSEPDYSIDDVEVEREVIGGGSGQPYANMSIEDGYPNLTANYGGDYILNTSFFAGLNYVIDVRGKAVDGLDSWGTAFRANESGYWLYKVTHNADPPFNNSVELYRNED